MAKHRKTPEKQEDPLTPSQSKAKKLIEDWSESSVGEDGTEESAIAKEFLLGIWHGSAVPRIPGQRKKPEPKGSQKNDK